MTDNWKTNNVERISDGGGRVSLYVDQVTTPSGRDTEYYHVELQDGVMVVPLRVRGDEVSFIFVQQYRYPVNRREFQFPGGAKTNAGETNEAAARRELKEETGYDAKSIKFFYSFNTMPSKSAHKMSVYVAYIEGEPGEIDYEEDEVDAGLTVKEFSADQVLKMIRDNEIADSKTLAALATVLLQSPKALEYANSFSHDETNDAEV